MGRFFPFLTLIIISLSSPVAMAQVFGASAQPGQYFASDNPQLRRLLDLQYQNQIIKRLIEREKIVNNMVQAALGVGISNPGIPDPDRTLCAQIPANLPCAQAFGELYPDYETRPSSAPSQLVPIPAPSATISASVDDSLVPQPPVSEAAALFWTDITCLEQRCSAVISPNPSDPQSRYRVTVGETLPDGAIISAINRDGVTLTRGKKTIRLDPAPAA